MLVDVRISQKPVSTFPAAAPRPGAADLRAAAARVRLSRRGDGRRRLAGIGVCRFRDGPWSGVRPAECCSIPAAAWLAGAT